MCKILNSKINSKKKKKPWNWCQRVKSKEIKWDVSNHKHASLRYQQNTAENRL